MASKEYNKQRYWERMNAAKEYLGGVCKHCGSSDNLELDHIDRHTKEFVVSQYGRSVSKDKFWDEVNKCQLLCKSCHIKKGYESEDIIKAEHGGFSMYQRHKCRCDICVEAYNKKAREYKREWRARKKALA